MIQALLTKDEPLFAVQREYERLTSAPVAVRDYATVTRANRS
jgi:hypothetical protein